MPRQVTLVVVDTDEESGQSNTAMVTINFESIDNPPVLDLNGPQSPGRDNSVSYAEESDPVMVRRDIEISSHWHTMQNADPLDSNTKQRPSRCRVYKPGPFTSFQGPVRIPSTHDSYM